MFNHAMNNEFPLKKFSVIIGLFQDIEGFKWEFDNFNTHFEDYFFVIYLKHFGFVGFN